MRVKKLSYMVFSHYLPVCPASFFLPSEKMILTCRNIRLILLPCHCFNYHNKRSATKVAQIHLIFLIFQKNITKFPSLFLVILSKKIPRIVKFDNRGFFILYNFLHYFSDYQLSSLPSCIASYILRDSC